MNIMNLTPHTITIFNDNDFLIKEYKPSGYVARVRYDYIKCMAIEGVPCIAMDYKNTYIIDNTKDGVERDIDNWLRDQQIIHPYTFIVSPITLQYCTLKNSLITLVAPDTDSRSTVRDKDTNRLIGVRKFKCNYNS